jgi:hypothetical protein
MLDEAVEPSQGPYGQNERTADRNERLPPLTRARLVRTACRPRRCGEGPIGAQAAGTPATESKPQPRRSVRNRSPREGRPHAAAGAPTAGGDPTG